MDAASNHITWSTSMQLAFIPQKENNMPGSHEQLDYDLWFYTYLSNKEVRHSKEADQLRILKNTLIQADPMFQPQMAFPSKAIYFKLCCPSSPMTKIFQKKQKLHQGLLFSCCFLRRKTQCGQTFLKMLMLKAFLSLRNSSYFYIGASTWLTSLSFSWECHGPSSGQFTEHLEGRGTWFLVPKVIQQSWHKVFRKTSTSIFPTEKSMGSL